MSSPAIASTPAPVENGASQLSVSLCPAENSGDWNDFLAQRPGGSFYHLYEWLQINEQGLGHRNIFLIARDSAGVRGVLPLTLVTSPMFGRILCSMPFVNYGGPCASDADASDALIQAARRQASELKVDYLELRCAAALDTDMPVSTRKISMTIELAADPDTLWNGFTSKHRKNVKRAYKNNLAVETGGIELLPTFYSVMEDSWRNLGTPLYARDYFERVLRTFPHNTRVFVCRRADEPVAVALTGHFNGIVEGLWAGGSAAARQLDANYVLYWEMISDACRRGYRSFHLGRSTSESGGEEFKRKWNAQATQLYWYFHRPDGGPMPALNVDNPKYRLAINAWRRLPLWMTRLIGPPIARAIP